MYDPQWDLKTSPEYKAMALRSLLTNSEKDLERISWFSSSGTSALHFIERLGSFQVAKEMELPQDVVELVLHELLGGLGTSSRYYLTIVNCIFCAALLKPGKMLDHLADEGPFMLNFAAQKIRERLNSKDKLVSSDELQP